MPILGSWGFHSPTPCDCGCATVESGWHLDQVQAAVCLSQPTSAQHHPVVCLGMEGWTSTITATLPGVLHSPCLAQVVWHV